ncbi:MAG: histidine ammonia-lyase [Acidimicrobiales bacterium]
MTVSTVRLRPEALTISEVVEVARNGAPVEIAESVAQTMAPSLAVVESAVREGRTVYGVTTGFGALAMHRIDPEQAVRVQQALVNSHAAGMGPLVEREVARAMQLLRARTLAAGRSGVRPDLVRVTVELLNAGITPAVPEIGSLGASGDLAPLAHSALVLTGSGWALTEDGKATDAGPRLAEAGIEPISLKAKEGLALLNGTDGMLAHHCLAQADLEILLKTVDIACAMTTEALLGTDAPFAERIHKLRPHPGQAESAGNLRMLLAGSPVLASHRMSDHAVQDAYSMRCAPQVHGAARDAVANARRTIEIELSSVIDNPVVFAEDGAVLSTGNFHGQPLAHAADFVAIALASLGGIVERRIDRMMDPARSEGLPPFLAPEAGVNSGFMLAHYTAAAILNRLRGFAAPSSIDSVSTSGGQEDHVSMGWNACRKMRCAVSDMTRVIAIEAVCAAEALDLRGMEPAPATSAVRAAIRDAIPRMDSDRFLAPDLATVESMVRTGELLDAAVAVVGPLR